MGNQAAGIKPSQLVKGGLRTDFNAEFTDLFWDYYTFPGKDGAPGAKAFGLHVQFTADDGEADEQFYSAGKPEEWAPSEDKSQPIPHVEGRSLNDNSNYAQFIRSVIEVGIGESKFETVKDLIGMNVFMSRVAQPSRAGLEGGDEKKRTVLVCKKLNRAPWEPKKSAGGKSKAAGKPAAGKPAQEAADVDEGIANDVAAIVLDLLSSGEYPDGLPVKAIMPAVFKSNVLDSVEYSKSKGKLTKAPVSTSVLGSIPGTTLEHGVLQFA